MSYRALSLFVLFAAVVAGERSARACGGCLNATPVAGGSQSPSVVTDHRIVLSLSATSTTLWDQLEYAGDPDGFAWVLPVRGEFKLGIGSDRFVDTLDQLTAPTLNAPSIVCRRGRGTSGSVTDEDRGSGGMAAGGCGGSTSPAPATRTTVRTNDGTRAEDDYTVGQSENDVVITDRTTVGPYDAVTIRPSAGANIVDWLRRNGYEVPFSIEPILKSYTSEGFDFVAVRLRPGFGTHAMRPIRVTWSGSQITFPLRLVAAGVAERVGIQLFVIGDGRWTTKSHVPFVVPRPDLVWDFAVGRSNYTKLRADRAEALGGGAFALEPSIRVTGDDFPEPEPLQPEPEPKPVDAGVDAIVDGDDASDADEISDVEDAEGFDANDSAVADVAKETAPPMPPQPADIELAFPGGVARRLTRLRADLPIRALDKDLSVEADVDQAYLSTAIAVVDYKNFQSVCPVAAEPAAPTTTTTTTSGKAPSSSDSGCECSTGPGQYFAAPPLALFAAAACASALRRATSRRR
jgi:hypothetical protein